MTGGSRTKCVVFRAGSIRHDNGAKADLAGVQCGGEIAKREPRFLTPRRQSVGRGRRRDGNTGALSRPARSLPMGYQTNLVFQRGRPVLQAQPAERRKSWIVTATIAKPSATGIASRRIADGLPVRSIAG